MTVLNEEGSLRGFLASLSAQTVTPAEIVVVDGGSTDATVALFEAWQAPAGCTVRVIVSPGANISEGRNQAIGASAHERILVTDAGTVLDPRWAELMLAGFDRTPAPDVVSGFFAAHGDTFVERTIATTITPHLSEIDGATFLPSSRSLGVTRAAWTAAEGYPEWLDYCEDLVFDLRMRELGFEFVFVGDAIVTWTARSSLASFMKQYYRYARGDGKAGLWRKRHIARYSAYAVGLVLLVASIAKPLLLVLLVVGFFAYNLKFWRRIAQGRGRFGTALLPALALGSVVVVSGDLAKMAGYPAGLAWRRHAHGG
jgi:glycosyltransferase involved in cell wall biosynthesis